MKTCRKCGETKEFELFHKSKQNKDGLHSYCKECSRKNTAKWKEKNRKRSREIAKKSYHKNRESILVKGKIYRQNNKEKIREQVRRSYEKNLERNKERDRIRARERYRKNRDQMRAKSKKYYKKYYKNRTPEQIEKQRKYSREYIKNKRDNDPIFRTETNIRRMLRKSFNKKNWKRTSKTQKIIGCNWEFLYSYLKNGFEKKYGTPIENAKEELHIDHIVPLSTAKTEEELIKLNHYTNLQYLYASHNLQKNNSLDWKLEEE